MNMTEAMLYTAAFLAGVIPGATIVAVMTAAKSSEREWLSFDNEYLRNRCAKLRRDLDTFTDLSNRLYGINWTIIHENRLHNRSAMVRKFLRKMGMNSENVCVQERVLKLIEEVRELETAVTLFDRKGIADAVADIQYVCESIPLLLKYDGDKAFVAVHESNMTKDPAVFKQDGRGKGDAFVEPKLDEIVEDK